MPPMKTYAWPTDICPLWAATNDEHDPTFSRYRSLHPDSTGMTQAPATLPLPFWFLRGDTVYYLPPFMIPTIDPLPEWFFLPVL